MGTVLLRLFTDRSRIGSFVWSEATKPGVVVRGWTAGRSHMPVARGLEEVEAELEPLDQLPPAVPLPQMDWSGRR